MAVDAFLWFEEIKGESQDEKHKDWIQIDSYSWGLSNPSSPRGGGGGGVGRATFQDFHFVTKISKASPVLFLSCASGKHIPKAVLSLRKSNADGAAQDDFLIYTLSELMVSDFSEAEDVRESPTNQFSLNFTRIEMEYKTQNADGQLADSVKAGWDIKKNQKA